MRILSKSDLDNEVTKLAIFIVIESQKDTHLVRLSHLLIEWVMSDFQQSESEKKKRIK